MAVKKDMSRTYTVLFQIASMNCLTLKEKTMGEMYYG